MRLRCKDQHIIALTVHSPATVGRHRPARLYPGVSGRDRPSTRVRHHILKHDTAPGRRPDAATDVAETLRLRWRFASATTAVRGSAADY